MKMILAVLMLSALVSVAHAENQPPLFTAKENFIRTALRDVQQSGDFYYIPFIHAGYCPEDQCKAEMRQATLETLSRFEKIYKVSVITYSVEETHQWSGGDYNVVVHGVFIKATNTRKK
jgi:hypothetical protein